ncbi:MAG TPA: SBBP repeat-containing protein, partial [Vicinamibacteria bacterium]
MARRLLTFMGAVLGAAVHAAAGASLPVADPPGVRELPARWAGLPIAFEPNRGQAGDADVRFLARAPGLQLLLKPDVVVIGMPGRPVAPVLEMRFPGASAAPAIAAENALPGHVSYFLGADPSRWRTGVPTFERVRYSGVYPGVDVVFHGTARALEYDVVVAPGADPSVVRLAFSGVDRMEVDRQGDLLLHTPGGVLRQRAPVTYQEVGGVRQPVAAGYRLEGGHVAFWTGAYDTARPLVIDPIFLNQGTVLVGGSGTDALEGLAILAGGGIVAIGSTTSSSILGGPGSADGTSDILLVAGTDMFSTVHWTAVIGGSGQDQGRAVLASTDGSIYLGASVRSGNMPLAGNPAQAAFGGVEDWYLARFTPDGVLDAATYGGGAAADRLSGMTSTGTSPMSILATGVTASDGLATPGVLQTTRRGTDAWVAHYTANLGIGYRTYLGGDGVEQGSGIVADETGRAYVTGTTSSTVAQGFPSINAVQADLGGGQDAFLAIVAPDGTGLDFSTHFGGSGLDQGLAIDLYRAGASVTPAGTCCIVGATSSTNLTLDDLFPRQGSLDKDAFALCLNPDHTRRVAFRMPARGNDVASAVRFDFTGNVLVGGETDATNYPDLNGFQRHHGSTQLGIATHLGSGSVHQEVGTATGYDGFRVATGDVDNDGFEDSVTLWVNSRNPADRMVEVGLGLGDGTFTLLPRFPVSPTAKDVALGPSPLQAGGPHLFIATASGIEVRLNTGNGTFGTPSLLPGSEAMSFGRVTLSFHSAVPTPDEAPRVVALRDDAPEVRTFDPTTQGYVSFTTSLPDMPVDMDSGDIDADGDRDTVVSTNTSLAVLEKTASGPLMVRGTITLAGGPNGVAFNDARQDGFPEILFTTRTGAFGVVENTGGTFGPPVVTSSGTGQVIDVGDQNGDGRGDVAVVVPEGGFVQVRFNLTMATGPVIFSGPAFSAGTRGPVRAAAADFNEDTRADLAMVGAVDLDGFLAHANITGAVSNLDAFSYLGGGGRERVLSTTWAGANNLYAVGSGGAGFPVTGGNPYAGGPTDGFLVKVSLGGQATEGTDLQMLGKDTNAADPSPAGLFEFYIRVKNNGPAAATGVRVEDELPPGMELVDASFVFDASQSVAPCGLPCDIGDLPAGVTAIVTVRVTISEPGTYTNTARVGADNDSTPGNNEDEITFGVVAGPELSVGFTSVPATATQGQPVPIAFSLVNFGGAGSNVTVRAECPGGACEDVHLEGFTCAGEGTSSVTCAADTVPADSTTPGSIRVRFDQAGDQ